MGLNSEEQILGHYSHRHSGPPDFCGREENEIKGNKITNYATVMLCFSLQDGILCAGIA